MQWLKSGYWSIPLENEPKLQNQNQIAVKKTTLIWRNLVTMSIHIVRTPPFIKGAMRFFKTACKEDGKFLLEMREKPEMGGGEGEVVGFVIGRWEIVKVSLAFPS